VNSIPILSLMILLPLFGVVLIMAAPALSLDSKNSTARVIALAVTLLELILGVLLWNNFDAGRTSFQFQEFYNFFDGHFHWYVGIDGISLSLIGLTVFLMPLCILASWKAIDDRVSEFMIAFLIMESLMIGVFTSLDVFMFYIFFEGGLIPMYLIIGIWGGKRRIYSSFKFFLYTFLGSVFMLLALLYMVQQAQSSLIADLIARRENFADVQLLLWLAFFASFAVKLPMWPVHTWLPDAHVEAPTAGSVILAGVLLKMGGYGFIRFSLPMFPYASWYFADMVFILSVIAAVYTSLVAFAQHDMKKLIAYSSVAHMAFVTLGLFSLNDWGIAGAMFQMISHGIISGALFLCVAVVYDQCHSREIDDYGGLVHRTPHYALVFMIMALASIGLPGTSGFVGEIISLIGGYRASPGYTAGVMLSLILGAGYMLWLYRRMFFGAVSDEGKDGKGRKSGMVLDLSLRERVIFAPLVVAVIWLGVFPHSVLNVLEAPVELVTRSVRQGIMDYKTHLPPSEQSAIDKALGAPRPRDVLAMEVERGLAKIKGHVQNLSTAVKTTDELPNDVAGREDMQ